jgi:hypothetical protein
MMTRSWTTPISRNLVIERGLAVACPKTTDSPIACPRHMLARGRKSKGILGGVLLLALIIADLLLSILRLSRRHVVLIRRVPLLRHGL